MLPPARDAGRLGGRRRHRHSRGRSSTSWPARASSASTREDVAAARAGRARPTRTRATSATSLIVAGSRGKTGAAHLAADGGAAQRRRPGRPWRRPRRACRSSPRWRRVHDASRSRRLPDGTVSRRPSTRVLAGAARRHRRRARASAPARTRRRSCAALLERAAAPLVLDADALTVLAGRPRRARGHAERPVVITPHPGEMARLVGMSAADVQRQPPRRRARLRDGPPRLRRPEGPSDARRDAGRAPSTSIRPAIPAWRPAARATC